MSNSFETTIQNIGVDISKDHFHVVLSLANSKQLIKVKASRKFRNDGTGFQQFEKWIDSKCERDVDLRILMEATGIYYEQLAWFLHQKGFHISVILPTKAKRYLQAIGNKSKNDKIDAKGLAQMGLEQRLPEWKPLSSNIYRLRLLTRQLEDFHKQRTAFLNQLHALQYSAYQVSEVEKSLKKMIKELEKGISQLEKAISSCIDQDDLLKSKVEKITSIKGVGMKTAAVIISETNGFANFESQAQLVSYAGYDVVENQSGQKSGRTKISKKGNAHIRRALHLPAFGVVKNGVIPFKAQHQRLLDRDKTKMQAYVAVQRKLLILIWALWRKDEPYDLNFSQQVKTTSSNEEPKPLFSLGSEGDRYKVAPDDTRATQDGLPCNVSPEALFSLK